MRYFLILLFTLGLHTFSAGENKCGSLEKCDPYEANVHNINSLQRGLGIYMNYCSTCHTLELLRWNRLCLLYTSPSPRD